MKAQVFTPNFIRFEGGLLHIFEKLKNGNISLQKAQKDQNKFKWKLNEITIGSPKTKCQ